MWVYIALTILFTFLFQGAAYEAYKFVTGAWNYIIMWLLYILVTISEYANPQH